jgi:hypothetical protein
LKPTFLWHSGKQPTPSILSCNRRSNPVATAPAFAELPAYPTRDEEFLGRFFTHTNIFID